MTREIGRRLVDGVWVTDVRDESAAIGSLPQTETVIASGVTTIADNASDEILFDTKSSGKDLLAFSDPYEPTLEPGFYVIEVRVDVEGQLNVGGSFNVSFQCTDGDGFGPRGSQWVHYVAPGVGPGSNLSAIGELPNTGTVSCVVSNRGGVSLDFQLISAVIMKIA